MYLPYNEELSNGLNTLVVLSSVIEALEEPVPAIGIEFSHNSPCLSTL